MSILELITMKNRESMHAKTSDPRKDWSVDFKPIINFILETTDNF